MLNQVVLVGRLTRDIVVNKSDKGIKVATISLAIPRSFKNSEGLYDTDFVDCVAFDSIASNTSEYCKKGDIVGVKGRVQSRTIENEGKKENIMDIICEKITFLSSHTKEEK
ncbi:MAG: single-stranded DNA-binding protein [Mollicutes bacterium]|nr:single-stranded DNA-binding protein [Mollicutes bacterium]MDY5875635.1 single-stranded DNA-binding protein [Bacilli bacterium]